VIRRSDGLIPIEVWCPGLEAVRGIADHGGPTGPRGPRVRATAAGIMEMEGEMGRLAVTTAMEMEVEMELTAMEVMPMEVMPMAVIMAATATDLQPRVFARECLGIETRRKKVSMRRP
jgi:hypothetical protein